MNACQKILRKRRITKIENSYYTEDAHIYATLFVMAIIIFKDYFAGLLMVQANHVVVLGLITLLIIFFNRNKIKVVEYK